MHKRMRRGKEMYPSFDTRRVLCKQHRPYCVKPLRARLKPSNASIAESILRDLKTGPTKPGRLRSIAPRPVLTKTQDEGQSTSAWSAMSRSALALTSRPDWRARTREAFQLGARTTVLKRPLHHHLDGCHLKSAPRGRKRRLLCGSKKRGPRPEGFLAGLVAQPLLASLVCKDTTSSTKRIKSAAQNTRAKDTTMARSQECRR